MKNVFRKAEGHEPKAEKIYKSRNLTDLRKYSSHCLKSLGVTLMIALLGLGLSGCSDDLEVSKGLNDVPDGYIQLEFNVPEPIVVNTRAGDSSIETLDIFIFNSEGTSFYQKETLSNVPSGVAQTIKLSGNAKNNGRTIYAVANKAGLDASYNSVEELEKVVLSESISEENGLVMTGKISVTASEKSVSLDLTRNVAKITMAFDENVKAYTLKGFKVNNANKNGYVGATTNTSYKYNNTNSVEIVGVSEAYLYPVETIASSKINSNATGAYLIIQASPAGEASTDYYYCLSIKDKEYDIEPNHIYAVTIEEINHAGFPSENDAIANVETGSQWVKYTIHDHAAKVMTMTSDGIRELGSERTIGMTSASATLIVKCYSPISSEISDNKPLVRVKEGDWLSVGTATKVTNPEKSGTDKDEDSDNTGIQWSFPLTANNVYSDVTATLSVSWMGLTREVKVIYDVMFNVKDICVVNVYFLEDRPSDYTYAYNSSGEPTDHDNNFRKYWQALDGSTGASDEKLIGLDAKGMGAKKVRNEGLHFPMPYGKNYTIDEDGVSIKGSWTRYEYLLDFALDPKWRFYGWKITEVKVQGDDKNMVEAILVAGSYNYGDNGQVIVRSTGKNGFDYWTGKIYITLVKDEDSITIPLDIYHTGFFYRNDNVNTTNGTSNAWYYYEVVPMGSYYWLDRNLGAKSNQMFVDNSTSTTPKIIGNADAKGLFYTIGEGGTWDAEDSDPTISDEVCPPGYHIPNVTEWDDLRLNPNFTSESLTSGNDNYISNFYDSPNSLIGQIYFPKAKYQGKDKEGNAFSVGSVAPSADKGDAGAGYYWSRTVSSGLEKEETGQWLKVLNLSGSSNTYINGNVNFDRMNVRCVAGATPSPETKHAIEFNVRGATHVYLYTGDDNNKSGIFTFPGKAVGTFQAVKDIANDDQKYLHFSYTGSYSYNQLKVFFTLVEDSGKVTIISNNTGSDPVTLENAVGWEVKKGGTYYFTWDSDFTNITQKSINEN